MRKAEVAFLAAAGAPPLVQTLLQSSERPQGGLLLIGPEGGVNILPSNLFARSVIERFKEGLEENKQVPTSHDIVHLFIHVYQMFDKAESFLYYFLENFLFASFLFLMLTREFVEQILHKRKLSC